MRISERIDAAKEECRVLDYEKATVADLDDIKARYRLSEPQFKEAAMAAISERMKTAELKQVELDAQRLDLINAAKAKGKRQAEIEILNSPLPWSREKMIAMVDLVVDWWLSQASYDETNEFSMDLACEITNGVRTGFIERVIELSATSFPEVRA